MIKLLEFSSLFNEKIRNPLNLALWEGFERNSSAFKVFLDLFCYRFMIFYAPELNNNSNTKCWKWKTQRETQILKWHQFSWLQIESSWKINAPTRCRWKSFFLLLVNIFIGKILIYLLDALIPVFEDAPSLDKVSTGLLHHFSCSSDCVMWMIETRTGNRIVEDLTHRNHVTPLQPSHQRVLKYAK